MLRAGLLEIITVADPGVQGAGKTGTQGIGVSTPQAAAVAEATVGLAMEVHTPAGTRFLKGTLSIMVAAGTEQALVLFSAEPISVKVAPKLHCIIAPVTTS